MKKWGVYLGVLASAVAVPKAAKETWTPGIIYCGTTITRSGGAVEVALCLCATQGYSRDGGSPVWLPQALNKWVERSVAVRSWASPSVNTTDAGG